jgi:chromosome segregation ATPase
MSLSENKGQGAWVKGQGIPRHFDALTLRKGGEMVKKILGLGLMCLLSLSFLNSVSAQGSEEQISAEMDALNERLSTSRKNYIETKKASRKAAMDNFLSFGQTKEEKAARKKVLEDAKKKEAELREVYKKEKEEIRNLKQQLKEQKKQLKQTKEKGKEKIKKTKGEMEGFKKKGKKSW